MSGALVGAAAALSIRHISKRRAPYFASALIGAIGIYVAIHASMRIAA
jgi:hypothetical protein